LSELRVVAYSQTPKRIRGMLVKDVLLQRTMRTKLALTLVATVCAYLMVHWAKGCISIDRCLDGSGRWNYQEGRCEWSDRVEPNSTTQPGTI
jgi:hypothetical protein